MEGFSHFNESGFARMVDVTDKNITIRTAIAIGKVVLNKETYEAVKLGKMKKGDVLAVAQVAGIMGAKKTSETIPMCHPIAITSADIDFSLDDEKYEINIKACVKCKGETGIEMEALNAVSVAALTIYDMCKAVQKDILISDIKLISKTGGKSTGVVTSVNISEKKGVIKKAVDKIELKVAHGIIGDAHAGDWHRQISLLADESFDKAKEKIPGLSYGAFAENINTRGIILYELPVGTILHIGETIVEVTQIGKHCHNDGCAIKKATGDCVMPKEGIFVIVLKGGEIKAGDQITVKK